MVGRVNQNRPTITVRVGIYGHFWQIPASWVFELPEFVQDQPKLIFEDLENGN